LAKIIKNPLVKPFLKWVGGKKQLLDYINQYKPKTFKSYYEPFVGGGAVFMSLQHTRTFISDYNGELINSYEVVRDEVDKLLSILQRHDNNNSKDYFYELREWDRNGIIEKKTRIERAARFIYLNKTCYNGLFRVNSQGQFNVPYGRYKKPNIINEEILRATSMFLNKKGVNIFHGDFSDAVKSAKKGDFIYFDPPYAPLVEDAQSFTGYTLNGFGYEEQLRLRDLFIELDKKGCYVMLSNSSSNIIHELYEDYRETTEIVKASRSVNSNASGRGKVDEVLIMNYDYKES